jgi:uncharacterized damage-inducible protein DinB
MITSMEAFLSYFRGVHQRTLRDVGLLPPEAGPWTPPVQVGEPPWSVQRIVGHVAAARLMFGRVYCGRGWSVPPEPVLDGPQAWLAGLADSYQTLDALLRETSDAWLSRRVALLDEPGDIAGWRVLMLMTEHEIHHRSQLATYAGLNGWPVADLFGRSYEQLVTATAGRDAASSRG